MGICFFRKVFGHGHATLSQRTPRQFQLVSVTCCELGLFSGHLLACLAVVSVCFKSRGASTKDARGHWAKRSKNVEAGERGGKGKSSVNQTHRPKRHPVPVYQRLKIISEAEENSFECPLLWKRQNFFRREIC